MWRTPRYSPWKSRRWRPSSARRPLAALGVAPAVARALCSRVAPSRRCPRAYQYGAQAAASRRHSSPVLPSQSRSHAAPRLSWSAAKRSSSSEWECWRATAGSRCSAKARKKSAWRRLTSSNSPHCAKLFQPELAYGLQHREARLPVRLPPPLQEALIDQRGDARRRDRRQDHPRALAIASAAAKVHPPTKMARRRKSRCSGAESRS